MDKGYQFAQMEQTKPIPWDDYHIKWCIAVAIISIILCIAFRNASDRTFRTIVLLSWIVMFVFELYKQRFISTTLVEGVLTYKWADFPFQLCSTPLYVLPVLGMLRNGSSREYAASYIITYTWIGGLSIYLFPQCVFSNLVAKNIQSMAHHGIQVFIGIFTAVWYRKKLNGKFFIKGVIVFLFMFMIAMFLNTTFRDYMIAEGYMSADVTFNMFLISPAMPFSSPIYEEYMLSLSAYDRIKIYIFGLTMISAVVILLQRIFLNIGSIFSRKKVEDDE